MSWLGRIVHSKRMLNVVYPIWLYCDWFPIGCPRASFSFCTPGRWNLTSGRTASGGAFYGGFGGLAVGAACGYVVQSALDKTPLPRERKETVARTTGMIVGVPFVVTGAMLGAVVGGTLNAEDYRQHKNYTFEAVGDTLDAMEQKRDHSRKRKQTSTGIATMPDEAAPFLLALAIARRARVISETDAYERASAFAVKCAVEKLSNEEILENAEAVGRELITHVKLRECFPKDTIEVLQESARALSEEDPDACDAAWIVCGSKPLAEWSKSVRKALPKTAADLSPDLLTRGLQAQFTEVKPSLVHTLQTLCPGGTEHDYDVLVSKFHQTLPASSFWTVWQLLQSPDSPDLFQGLTYDQLASPQFMDEFHKSLNAKIFSDTKVNLGQKNFWKYVPTSKARCKNKAAEVRCEVLKAESLSNPEYRIGDMTSSVFGAVGLASKSMHPYVEVSWGGFAGQTRTLDTTSDGNAHIGESFTFRLLEDLQKTIKRCDTVTFRAFDARGAQAVVRGDPLFGEGTMRLTEKTLMEGSIVTVELKRGKEVNGYLKIRFAYRPSQQEQEVLACTNDSPLAVVLKALVHVLHLPCGVDMLMEARPLPTQGMDASSLRCMLQDWTKQFAATMDRLDADASDEDTVKRMANTSASMQMIVSTCAPLGTSLSQVQGIAAQWIHNFLIIIAAWVGGTDKSTAEQMAQIDDSRIMKMMHAGSEELKRHRLYNQHGSNSITAPPYWLNQSMKKGETIKVRTRELDDIFLQQLRHSATHRNCTGRDGTFNIGDVTSVKSYRLENIITWAQYRNKVAELTARLEAAGIHKCPTLQPPVPKCMFLKGAKYDKTMNEVFLWHATKHDIVDTIINEGFDERVCSLNGLYGAGLYFSEESCKSGQYAKKHRGRHYFFLARVFLGRPHYATSNMNQTRRAPDGSDCVIANVGSAFHLGHRELIVYDRFQAYPEFLIEAHTTR